MDELFKIKRVQARQILDSRGNPTVEVECRLSGGAHSRASVPSGASTGSREAVELRDGDAQRFGGKGVLKAVANVNDNIAPILLDQDARQQAVIDQAMITLDGTPNKARLGANAMLGVSLAVARAAASACSLPLYQYLGGPGATRLPVPHMNILNGGVHAHWQGADFQEFMIAPFGADSFHQALEWGSEIYHALQAQLEKRGLSVGVGDEGGFAPHVRSNEEPFELIVEAIGQVGLRPGQDVGIACDPASSEFFDDAHYHLRTEDRRLDSTEMAAYYQQLADKYPLVLLEDGMAEDDWTGWQTLNQALGDRIELVGDDIFCTNPAIIARGIEQDIANAVLIKLNQIGTLTETIAATRLARDHGWGAFVSHRSGETVDSFIADLTVALDTGHLKTGAPARGERVEKYNQLLRIEEHLGDAARYAGVDAYCRKLR
ncbi:enolase [bacterium BMS3Bbin11]|nr:enolase [bacterium BMS3Abin11]GBE45021.1 enolase [bacterium BMS3Bbin11]HDH07963.1 phosphopyruvate hydratase [Gammaproteobacteria bacterium]HDZ78959.1 phosphopyruvate hydratase [Gammaproteobacteria bacterium]